MNYTFEHSEDALPVRLDRRTIYILPTRHGALFLAVLFAMLLGSINYNNNLGFLLVFLLGAMVLVSVIHTWRNLLGLTVVSAAAEPVFAGEAAEFAVEVSAGGISRQGVTYGFEGEERIAADIQENAQKPLPARVRPEERGIFAPGWMVFATRYPLGLFRAWSKVDTGAAVIVYPRPVAVAFEGDPAGGDAGMAGGETLVRGVDDFSGLSSYQPGDPIHRISWKALSRGQGVFTKQFHAENGRAVIFDYGKLSATDRETRLSQLAHLVQRAESMQIPYGLTLPGRHLPPATGESHRRACLQMLAMFPGESGEGA
jgi:uncharacterized protein (DUF58 family)